MSISPLTGVTETVGEALSTGTAAVHGLAATAAELATELAVAAVEQLEVLPERVRDRFGAAPRRTWRPRVLVAAAVATILVVGWWAWRRRAAGPEVDSGVDRGRNPARAHTNRAASAAGT